MITLMVDGDPGDRLQEAFAGAFPGKVARIPSFAVPDGGLARFSRWRLCVGPELGRRIKLQGWRDGLILAISREQFAFARRVIGVCDSLLFHDVEATRLRAAVRLAVSGMTLFPSGLAPDKALTRRVLEGFGRLADDDRLVLAELTLGRSNRQIAEHLERSPEHVRQSVNRICRRLHCQNRTEAAVLAYGRLRPFLELPAVLPPDTAPQPQG